MEIGAVIARDAALAVVDGVPGAARAGRIPVTGRGPGPAPGGMTSGAAGIDGGAERAAGGAPPAGAPPTFRCSNSNHSPVRLVKLMIPALRSRKVPRPRCD